MFRRTAVIVAALASVAFARKNHMHRFLEEIEEGSLDERSAANSAAPRISAAFDAEEHKARAAHNGGYYSPSSSYHYGGGPSSTSVFSGAVGPYGYSGAYSGGYPFNAYPYPYDTQGVKPINYYNPPKDIQTAQSICFCAKKNLYDYSSRDVDGYYAGSDVLTTYDGDQYVGVVTYTCWTDNIYFSKCEEFVFFAYDGKRPFSILYHVYLEDIRGGNPHNYVDFILGTTGFLPPGPFIAGFSAKLDGSKDCDYYYTLSYAPGYYGYDPTFPVGSP